MAGYVNPLSRREVLKFGAYTTVGGVLTPGVSLAQAIVTDTKGIAAGDVQLDMGGTRIPAYEARPGAAGRPPRVGALRGFPPFLARPLRGCGPSAPAPPAADQDGVRPPPARAPAVLA